MATIVSQVNNPITGVFGNGMVQVFGQGGSGTWIVPDGVNNVRVRVFGCGGGSGGSGGGFALKTIYNLAGQGITSVAITIAPGGGGGGATTSFGSFVSATGGLTGTSGAGTGVGGDINYTGGLSMNSSGGGGVANLFGNGGNGTSSFGYSGASGGGGGGSGGHTGGNGIFGSGCSVYVTSGASIPSTSGMPSFSIDYIGTGGGGAASLSGINGGGGGSNSNGGYPGGGGQIGAAGMVIVEW